MARCRFHFGDSGPCGSPWWKTALDRLLRRPPPKIATHLLAFKPVAAGRSSRRRGPDYLHAQLTSLDFSQPDLLEAKLGEAAEWVALCLAAAVAAPSAAGSGLDGGPADGILHTLRGRVPPALLEDDLPSPLDAAVDYISSVLRWARSSSGLMAGSGLGEKAMQLISTVVIVIVLGLLHLVWFQ